MAAEEATWRTSEANAIRQEQIDSANAAETLSNAESTSNATNSDTTSSAAFARADQEATAEQDSNGAAYEGPLPTLEASPNVAGSPETPGSFGVFSNAWDWFDRSNGMFNTWVWTGDWVDREDAGGFLAGVGKACAQIALNTTNGVGHFAAFVLDGHLHTLTPVLVAEQISGVRVRVDCPDFSKDRIVPEGDLAHEINKMAGCEVVLLVLTGGMSGARHADKLRLVDDLPKGVGLFDDSGSILVGMFDDFGTTVVNTTDDFAEIAGRLTHGTGQAGPGASRLGVISNVIDDLPAGTSVGGHTSAFLEGSPKPWRLFTPRYSKIEIHMPKGLRQTDPIRYGRNLAHEYVHAMCHSDNAGFAYFATRSEKLGAGYASYLWEFQAYVRSHGLLAALNPRTVMPSVREMARNGVVSNRHLRLYRDLGATGMIVGAWTGMYFGGAYDPNTYDPLFEDDQ